MTPPATSQCVTEDVATNQAQISVSSTPPGSSSNIFACQESFVNYLAQHLKSKNAMTELLAGSYSIEARRSITQVAVSKMVDTYGLTPSTEVKSMVSSFLAAITKMKATDYFDSKTHKGFLNKDLENRRRKLPPSEKCWIWSKKRAENVSEPIVAPLDSEPPVSGDGDVHSRDVDLDGCPRHITECPCCNGLLEFLLL